MSDYKAYENGPAGTNPPTKPKTLCSNSLDTHFPFLYSQLAFNQVLADFCRVREPNFVVANGKIIYCSIGSILNGHGTDIDCTSIWEKSQRPEKKTFRALNAGYDAALAESGPAVRMLEVFNAMVSATCKAGPKWDTWGLMGRTVKVACGNEHPPFISVSIERMFEPDMGVCLRAPLYLTGFGGFQIDAKIMMAKNGHEIRPTLPRD